MLAKNASGCPDRAAQCAGGYARLCAGRYESRWPSTSCRTSDPRTLEEGCIATWIPGVAAKVEFVIAHLYRSIFRVGCHLPWREAFEAKLCESSSREHGIHRFWIAFSAWPRFARIVKERGVETACPCPSAPDSSAIATIWASAEQGVKDPWPVPCSPSTGVCRLLHPRFLSFLAMTSPVIRRDCLSVEDLRLFPTPS